MRDAVRAFWRLQRAREEAWIIGTLGSRIPEQAVLDLFADESARALEFQRGQDRRLERDFGVLLSRAQAGNITPAKVKERLGQITAREQLYATRRSEAMAARALALADRIILRGDSPQGAFWKLGQADKHTPDCVAMAGRFWPWEALAIIHPPSHTGCKCSLWSYKTAVAKGWMKAGDVMDVRTAMIKAAAAKLLLHEEEAEGMVEALLREGLVGSVEEFARASALALPTGRST